MIPSGMNMGTVELRDALRWALKIIEAHPAFTIVSMEPDARVAGDMVVDMRVHLGLPLSWMAEGQSPNGVLADEPVRMTFPASYPLRPPEIRLRADFDRSVAHVQPGSVEENPEPCLVYGKLSEFHQRDGLPGILDQLVLWLEHAAMDRLIDFEQGWEPVRRDTLMDFLVFDADRFRSMVKKDRGHAWFGMEYWISLEEACRPSQLHGVIGPDPVVINRTTIRTCFGESKPIPGISFGRGRSLALLVWPGKAPDGRLVVTDRYRPETVTDMDGLFNRAGEYGCVDSLKDALGWLEKTLVDGRWNTPTPIAVVLAARRPVPLIDSTSDLELCPYLVDIWAPRLFPTDKQPCPVKPAGHRQTITADLLRRLSGGEVDGGSPPWVQLGCGSLGSKIAIHMARAGRAPGHVIDSATMSPHNMARHALFDYQGFWPDQKADRLSRTIAGLGQRSIALTKDIVLEVSSGEPLDRLFPPSSWAIVNSTASLAVREALGAIKKEPGCPRVIETSLLSGGRIGLLTVEGPNRSPNTLDLIAETYEMIRQDSGLGPLLFGEPDGHRIESIGEGCGSETMVMSDARVSMFAAPVAEAISSWQDSGLPPDGGRIVVGGIGIDGMSLNWKSHAILAPTVICPDNAPSWEIRIAKRVQQSIDDEILRWPGVETGGILMGRTSVAANTLHVIDVIPAPEDSKRASYEFVLGTKGIRAKLRNFGRSCGDTLYCIGTWHSHLRPSGPSTTDRKTASLIGLASLMPGVLLIRTPEGFRGVLTALGDHPKTESAAEKT